MKKQANQVYLCNFGANIGYGMQLLIMQRTEWHLTWILHFQSSTYGVQATHRNTQDLERLSFCQRKQ